jgi:isopenicillin-N N-acyltransferase like protein
MRLVRRILKWSLITLASLLIFFITWFLLVAIDHPPQVTDRSALETERVKTGENAYTLGNNWLRKSESGLWEMYLEGDPFERGVAFGKLTNELLAYQESAFFSQIRELVPSEKYLRFLKYFLAWFNRNLDKNIPDEYKLEIYGTSFACSPEFNFIGSGYQRQLNYHAAHDIGHALQGLNMVGCTSFSVWDGKSADSTLIIGRNFDFYAGRKFAENKIVCFVNPTQGYKFMMITWADMTGVVSGMNEKGLTVTINAAKSSVPGQAATPVSIVAREILQYASNINEAYEIAGKRKMFVSESFLIGSAADGKSAIIEKSPQKQDIVYPAGNQIVCANHFQGDAFRNDKSNIENIAGSDSKYRFDRVNELLSIDSVVDVNDAVSILRNRMGKENADLGMGNPLAINQLIAHHSVVFKPSLKLVWVSTSPYQLGKFVAYDLGRIFSLSPADISHDKEIYTAELTIPSDPFLSSEGFTDYMRYLGMTDELITDSRNKKDLSQGFENAYISSNPLLYATYSHLADYFAVMKDYTKAGNYYKLALAMQVPGKNKRDDLMNLLEKSLNKSGNAKKGN